MSIKSALAQAAQIAAQIQAAEVAKNRDVVGAKTGDHANGERRGNGDVWWNGSWHTSADYNALIQPTVVTAPIMKPFVPGGVLQNIQGLVESSVELSVAAEQDFLFRANNAATQEEQDAIVADWQERENMAARAASRTAKRVAATVKIQKIAFGVTAAVITAGAVSAVSGLATSSGAGATVAAKVEDIIKEAKKADDIKKDVVAATKPPDYLAGILADVDNVLKVPITPALKNVEPDNYVSTSVPAATLPAVPAEDFLMKFFAWLSQVLKG